MFAAVSHLIRRIWNGPAEQHRPCDVGTAIPSSIPGNRDVGTAIPFVAESGFHSAKSRFFAESRVHHHRTRDVGTTIPQNGSTRLQSRNHDVRTRDDIGTDSVRDKLHPPR